MIELHQGDGPVVLAQPHTGTEIPDDCLDGLNDTGRVLADTDWHVHRLYDGLLDDATVVRTTVHRYVIDVNRDPQDVSLYPGQHTTGLCPTTDFDGRPIYKTGREPAPEDIAARRRAYHTPYHEVLAAEIERVHRRHGVAVLYDCHSIRSNIPYLFDGNLPVFNIGTNHGATCADAIEKATETVCSAAERFSTVVNGRFKGGWTTRHYGNPVAGIHAIQMELAQRAYMDETPPWPYRAERAEAVRKVLQSVLETLRELALSGEAEPSLHASMDIEPL